MCNHVKLGLSVGGMLLCVWIRALINCWEYFILIASIFGAIFDCLQQNISAKMAANWFPLEDQVMANTITTITGSLGGIFGSFYALTFIDTSVEDKDEARSMILKAMIYLAITYSVMYVIGLFFYKDKPETPPWYFYIL